ncbi:MAG: methyl-accepting chemotaxis protein, partial [Thiomonas sp.]|uniref:methyl-accepting chemotaxis protein n=1 Tax=Thiomonas sp. TaxID=2047785 RepID=UPI002A36BDA8
MNHLRIRTRMTLGLIGMLAVIVLSAVLAQQQLAQSNARLGSIVHVQARRIDLLNTFFTNFQSTTTAFYQALLNPAHEQAQLALKKQLAANRESTERAFEALQALPPNAEVNHQLAQIKSLIAKNRGVQQQVISLMRQGLYPQASTLYTQLAAPIVLAMHQRIETLIDHQQAQMQAAYAQSQSDYASAARQALWITLGFVLAATAGGFWITRSITRPLSQAVEVARRVAGGDLSVRVLSPSKDETGQLLAALGQMVTQLTAVIGSVRSSAEQLLSASGQVSSTSQSIAQSTSQQAASVEQTSATLE